MSKTSSSSPPDSSVAPARARYEKLRPVLGTHGPRHTTHLVHASLSLDALKLLRCYRLPLQRGDANQRLAATETIYRHVVRPNIRGGAAIMDDVFGDPDDEAED